MSAPQVKDVFLNALAQENAAARRNYLEQVCVDDAELRRRVELLLEAHDEPASYLDRPALDLKQTTANFDSDSEKMEREQASDAVRVTEGPGGTIAQYRILQEIGQGGFGVVYMAEQQSPVRRTVALKIIKPGMDTREVIARFEAERQALALMDHPNIARVLDAGATASGRPYFVMELVRGVPLSEFCDKNQFSTKKRLEMFVTICQAVQHAHQKGVIHRDLKPSNIMVTLHDGKPVPKVIDFGISKAIAQKLTDKTLFTRYGQMIGTPQYMSPEQAEMSGLDVDTRSDVYSLGVILYELLTGTTPLEIETLREAGHAEMLRLIQDQEAPKPSTRLSTLADRLTITCKQRSTNERMLSNLVRGDLDWIVMKALEKDRSRRYDTANALAEDIGRHLNDEPVLAGAPSSLYLAKKLIRRNRGLFAASLAIAASLLIGSGLMLVGFLQANRDASAATIAKEEAVEAGNQASASANEARREADNARQVLTLIGDMLKNASPEENANSDMTVRQMLKVFTVDLDQKSLDPNVEADIRLTIGKIHLALLNRPIARKHLRRAFELKSDQTNQYELSAFLRPLAVVESASLHGGRGPMARYEPAIAYARQSVELEKQFQPESVGHLEALETLASVQMLQNEYAQAEQNLNEAMRIALLPENRVADAQLLPTIRMRRIECLLRNRPANFDSARMEALELASQFRQILTEPHPKIAESLITLGRCQMRCGRYIEAEKSFREADEMLGTIGSGPIQKCRRRLAEALQAQDRFDEANQVLTSAIEEFDVTWQGLLTDGLILLKDRIGNYVASEFVARKVLEKHEENGRAPSFSQFFLALALYGSDDIEKRTEGKTIFRKNYRSLRERIDVAEPDSDPLLAFVLIATALSDLPDLDLEYAITAVKNAKQIELGTERETICDGMHARLLYNHGRKQAAMDVLEAARPSGFTCLLQFEYLVKDAGLEAAIEFHPVAYKHLCDRYGERTYPVAHYQWFVAKTLVEQGQHELAKEPLLASMDYFKTHGQVHHFRVPICLRMLSEIYTEIGDREKAADSLTELDHLAADYGNPILDVIGLFEPAASTNRP